MSVVIWSFLLLYQNMLICNAEYAGEVDVPLDDVHQHITCGRPAAPCQFPRQVVLIIDNNYFCGGSLMRSRWVFTVAHCA